MVMVIVMVAEPSHFAQSGARDEAAYATAINRRVSIPHCDKNVIKLIQTGKLIVTDRIIVKHRSL